MLIRSTFETSRELLRDANLIRERWVRNFRSLLNAKSSETLDPTVISTIPQRLVTEALGEKPTEDEGASALRSMANAKALARTALQRSC